MGSLNPMCPSVPTPNDLQVDSARSHDSFLVGGAGAWNIARPAVWSMYGVGCEIHAFGNLTFDDGSVRLGVIPVEARRIHRGRILSPARMTLRQLHNDGQGRRRPQAACCLWPSREQQSALRFRRSAIAPCGQPAAVILGWDDNNFHNNLHTTTMSARQANDFRRQGHLVRSNSVSGGHASRLPQPVPFVPWPFRVLPRSNAAPISLRMTTNRAHAGQQTSPLYVSG